MPQGNAHFIPPGLWYQSPTTSSIPRLLMKSFGQLFILGSVIYAVQQYRELQIKYTYKTYIGRTMTLGTLTTDTHEPLPKEEIDKLKAKQAAGRS